MGNQASLQAATACTIKDTVTGLSEKQNIKYALSGMRGFRPSMEDRCAHHLALQSQETVLDDHSLFAVFDGHGGDFASSFLEANFLAVLQSQPEFVKYVALPESGLKSREDTNGIILLREALIHAFVELDKKLIAQQQERNYQYSKFAAAKAAELDLDEPVSLDCSPALARHNKSAHSMALLLKDDDEVVGGTVKPIEPLIIERSGSTAVVVVLTPSHIVCANTGDSRAFLRRSGTVLPLSFDHKPAEIAERSRIEGAGGIVKGKRIDGDLAVSRAFGDFVFKLDTDLSVDKQKVSVIPDVTIYPRDLVKDEFIVMACDGIWDVASNKDCSDFIQAMLSDGDIDLGNICEEAMDTCLHRNSRDNMTIGIIQLPGMVYDANRAASGSGILWSPRTARAMRRLTQQSMIMASSTIKKVGEDIYACS